MEKAPRKVPVVILGGGIAGLSLAFGLKKKNIPFELYEIAERSGGKIQTLREEGYLLEKGPNSLLSNSLELKKLILELGLENQMLETGPAAKNRYVLHGGRLHKLPSGPWSFFLSKLLPFKSKLKILTEGKRRNEPVKDPESLADFALRRADRHVLERLLTPMVTGIWGGDPEKLEAQSAFPAIYEMERKQGSILKGMKAKKASTGAGGAGERAIYSLRDGLGALTRKLHEACGGNYFLQSEAIDVTRVSKFLAYRWQVEIRNKDIFESVKTQHLVMALPSYVTTGFLRSSAPVLCDVMEQIEYAGMAVVHLGFSLSAFPKPLDGFGFLSARGEKTRTLGAIWNSCVFPNRAPEGKFLITAMYGGPLDPGVLKLDSQTLGRLAADEIKSILRLKEDPEFLKVSVIPAAIPQYNLGHAGRMELLEDELKKYEGLQVCGNFRGGISVGDVVKNSLSLAEEISRLVRPE